MTITTNNPAGPCPAVSDSMALCFFSCAAPVADFTASDTTICDSTCINFSDLSTNNPTSWEWSFPGATPDTSNDQNPVSICYSAPGNYTVTLVATNGSGSDDTTMTNYIIVDTASTAYAGPDTNICDTGSYTITGATIGGSATSLLWTTSGNGTFDDSTLLAAIYTPSAADTAAGCVTLTITTNNPAGPCPAVSDSMVLCFYSCAAPVADFSSSDTIFCEGACIDFTDLSMNATGWMWYFPGGTPDTSTAQNPTGICFDSVGTYTNSLVATNANGQDSIAKIIVVDSCPPPVANFSSSDTTFCVGACIDFSDLSSNTPTSWAWSFPGAVPSSDTLKNPVGICYDTAGTYDVILTVTNASGTDDTTFTGYITVNSCPAPVANFTASDTVICEGDTVNFTALSPNTTTWAWLFPGGTPPVSNDSTFSVIYSSSGTYSVTLTVSNVNGSDTLIQTSYITVNPLPTVNLGADITFCIGDSAVLDAGASFSSYLWQDGSANQTLTTDTAGIYFVKVTDLNGCEGNDTVILTVNSLLPVANFGYSDSSLTVTFTDSSVNETMWVWDFGDGNTDTVQNPVHTYAIAGSYNVCLIAGNACGSDSICDSVTAKVIKIQLFIPNAFSPNGDGENDVFRIIGSGITKIYLAVYDRWGVRVFETEDIKEAIETGWDGKYKRKEQGMAVFVYYVKVKFVDGTSDTKKGDVTLIR
ncbi:MAG: PKD domain-containing protein [Cytophagales bacterium]|nr:PKD domain-containing protein [Cytophagales bacterium]